MAIVGVLHRGIDAVGIAEGMQFADALRTDHLHREVQALTDLDRLVKPVHLVHGTGQPQRSAAMPGDGLTGLRLQHL